MKASELIKALQLAIDKNGDLDVVRFDEDDDMFEISVTSVAIVAGEGPVFELI